MVRAQAIIKEESCLELKRHEITALAQGLKRMQDELLQIQEGFKDKYDKDPEVVLRYETLRKKLVEKHEEYKSLCKEFDSHNIRRQLLHMDMKEIDSEVKYSQEHAKLISIQIEEMNKQITKLNEKKESFKSATDYLVDTRKGLEAFKEEIQKEVMDLSEKTQELMDLQFDLQKEQKSINEQIDNADMKLKFHQDRDEDIISEAKAQIDKILKQVNSTKCKSD